MWEAILSALGSSSGGGEDQYTPHNASNAWSQLSGFVGMPQAGATHGIEQQATPTLNISSLLQQSAPAPLKPDFVGPPTAQENQAAVDQSQQSSGFNLLRMLGLGK